MKILLWHGYLLGGTGSNVYTRALAREWSLAGHEVVVLSQERHPERFDLGHATGVRPEIGGILPVFVVDRYEGLEPRKLQDLTRAERERYVELNARAVRERPRPAEPGAEAGAAARRRERGAPGGVLRGGRADGRLLRQAPLEQGRPRPARGASRPRRARGRRRLRRLPARARGDGARRHA